MATAGRLIGVAVNSSFISCEISATITLDQEMLPASAIDSGRWKEFINGVRGWSISVNAALLLEAVGADMKTILTSSYFDTLPLFVQFRTPIDATKEFILSGAALFPGGSITAESTGAASTTIQLQGTGPLTPDFQDYELLIDSMPPEADYPIIVNEGFYTT